MLLLPAVHCRRCGMCSSTKKPKLLGEKIHPPAWMSDCFAAPVGQLPIVFVAFSEEILQCLHSEWPLAIAPWKSQHCWLALTLVQTGSQVITSAAGASAKKSTIESCPSSHLQLLQPQTDSVIRIATNS